MIDSIHSRIDYGGCVYELEFNALERLMRDPPGNKLNGFYAVN